MVDRDTVERWIQAYRAAARSDDPDAVKALFTEDAEYHDGPFGEPWRGHDEIVRNWLAQSDTPYEFEISSEIFASEDSRAVVELEYRYMAGPGTPRTYRNVWLLDLADGGRARLFKDYWIEEPKANQND